MGIGIEGTRMKSIYLVVVAAFMYATNGFSATCTSISRTNLSANSVLTSTEYNGSLNTAYSAINALDLGCAASGSFDDEASFNSTVFAPVLKGVKEGCVVTNTDSNTIRIGKCLIAVNGLMVSTSSTTDATWGCSGCTSESASTRYYVYAKTGSTGSTLNLLISSTAPNADGYDNSGDRVLGTFFNNAASDIEDVRNQELGNTFESGTLTRAAVLNCDGTSTVTTQVGGWITSVGNISSGACSIVFNGTPFSAAPICQATSLTSTGVIQLGSTTTTSSSVACTVSSSGSNCSAFDVNLTCTGQR